jgi:hypothetical protein
VVFKHIKDVNKGMQRTDRLTARNSNQWPPYGLSVSSVRWNKKIRRSTGGEISEAGGEQSDILLADKYVGSR